MAACFLYIRAVSPVKLVAAAVLLFATACAKPYDPFRIPRDQLRGRIHTIALAPLRVDSEIADAAPARQQIEPLVAARLAAGGFAVVEAEEMDRLWHAAANVGTVLDPLTGKLDQTRFDLVQEAVYRELAARRRVDAVLYLNVRPVDLYLAGKSVDFCGVKDATYWRDGSFGLLDQATLVRAACLVATLFDMEGRALYSIQSGIETFETYAQQTRAARPRASRLTDEARLRRAVDMDLGPLTK